MLEVSPGTEGHVLPKKARTERIHKDGAIFKAECAPDSSIAKCFQVLRESGLGELLM